MAYARHFGVRATARHYLGNALARFGVLRIGGCYVLDELMRDSEHLQVVEGAHVRRLTAEEIELRAAGREERFVRAEVAGLLTRGDACFAVFMDGEIACSVWYAFRPLHQYGVDIGFPTGAVWAHRLYTAETHRRRGLPHTLRVTTHPWLRSQGYTRLMCLIEWTNEASLRLHRQQGYRRIGTLVRFGGEHRGRTFLLGGRAEGLFIARS